MTGNVQEHKYYRLTVRTLGATVKETGGAFRVSPETTSQNNKIFIIN
jgi:hypothetical protein